jgi:hypothetical protein
VVSINPTKWLLQGRILTQYCWDDLKGFSVRSSGYWLILFGVLLAEMVSAEPGQKQPVENPNAANGTAVADVHPILVELFTSEGCSSCPPADALLEKMDMSAPISGAQFVVLSEHVDYWDHDGWKDPHSSSALTERQDDYVRALRLKTAYTPQFIVDGTSEVRANDGQAANKVFQEAASAAKIPVRIGEVNIETGNPSVVRARIEADGESDSRNADVYVAVALDRVESQVLHGENGGKHLTHVAVVVQLTKVGKLAKGKSFAETVQLKLKPSIDQKNVRIVAFVQEPGPGKLLGAALRRPTS